MSVSATSNVQGTQGQQATTGTNAYENLDLDQFIKILVTEMQNQDPMEPMKNSEIVNQVAQIRAIESNQRLSSTLESVLLGQNLSTAATMIGWNVSGLDDDAKEVSGTVSKVAVENGEPKLYVGDKTVSLKNVREVLPVNYSVAAGS